MKNKKKIFFYSYEVFTPNGDISQTGHGTFDGNPTSWEDALKELENVIRKRTNIKDDDMFHLVALNPIEEVKE